MKLSFPLKFKSASSSLASRVALALFAVWLTRSAALAAACCGGGSSMATLISGDDRATLSANYARTNVVVDSVDSRGIWHTVSDHQSVETLRLEGAHVFGERWQAGFTLPMQARTRAAQSESGLSDLSGSIGYEYLPDWDYNPYRPKGIGYLQLTLPTGKSRAESESGGLDSRGNGFLALGAGTLLSKIIGHWDVLSTVEIHRGFPKVVQTSVIQGTLHPGFGGSAGLGGGYDTAKFRFGTSLTWTYEDAIVIDGASPSNGASERYATWLASVSYIASDSWSAVISYADQTLFGNPVNTSLGRTVSLAVQRRWSR